MRNQPTDPALALPLSGTPELADQERPTRLEEEVVSLFDELRSPLFRYILSFGLTVQDCEDVIQEVFLALFKHLQMGRSRQNLQGWVFRVAHNLSLKRRGANQKTQERQDDVANVEHQLDQAPSAEEQLVFHERQARLLAVYEALPQEDRCCLQLRAEGLSYRDISGILGISLGSVATYLTRSLNRLSRADRR
jgi:RNA polymerase sigma-70 factor, ECF subfamily